jgi:hypothetical protein
VSDARVNAGVRIPVDLKKRLQAAAKREDRTLSKLCEILLAWSLQQLESAGDTMALRDWRLK